MSKNRRSFASIIGELKVSKKKGPHRVGWAPVAIANRVWVLPSCSLHVLWLPSSTTFLGSPILLGAGSCELQKQRYTHPSDLNFLLWGPQPPAPGVCAACWQH